ncbi:hypothetical protein ACIBLB_25820 [Streptosporangium canum]|uniref:hypothetical protein n=1 Tax=Streptosporangium canum TaxID=324952 RepID=UPI003796B07D
MADPLSGEDNNGPAADRPAVLVVMDPTDDAAVTAAALQAHNPGMGRITVHPTPAASNVQTLAHDLLTALGKPLHRLGAEKITSAHLAWQTALAWLSGERHQQVVVLRAHLMNETRWASLLEIPVLTGAQLVLIHHAQHLSPAHQRLLSPIAHQITHDITEALPSLHGQYPHEDPSPPGVPLPALPRSDFPHFRAEMFRHLSAEQFAAADAEYTHGIAAACRWLTRHAAAALDSRDISPLPAARRDRRGIRRLRGKLLCGHLAATGRRTALSR